MAPTTLGEPPAILRRSRLQGAACTFSQARTAVFNKSRCSQSISHPDEANLGCVFHPSPHRPCRQVLTEALAAISETISREIVEAEGTSRSHFFFFFFNSDRESIRGC